ncbi:ubiquitin-like-specific protease 1D [Carica papaya]|uniref:ubiquitin-like-specific protease 1D n=1 Tax=Carica papaya TaxID=3649 RepID=UPI000B8CBEF5|nr:ubiquitin-like-specific protease 1D [Carica papaya]
MSESWNGIRVDSNASFGVAKEFMVVKVKIKKWCKEKGCHIFCYSILCPWHRDDPESVEICFKDMECLAPEGYLTSPIMNFYIQYLQQQASPSNRAIYDCHFFNTYFYKKLKEALSFKGNDKEAFFVKFRRWWKGVNIFQKAYVLIPIHEDLHWSLVIICIPDKEDESGPIILHLDSLAFHSSRSVFDNIRSYLKAEWNYLNQDVTPLDLPIADRIWRHLPRRIDEKILTVPQQKNDYDCGLFVLFFMERFIEEAPERLKKKDLAMFGRQWFKPEEASGLRAKIRHILLEQFKKACK